MPVAPPDRNRPARRRRPRRTYTLPSNFRTEAPARPRRAPRAGPPTPRALPPRPSGPRAFEPFRGGSPDRLQRVEVQQRKRTRQARRRLPAHPAIPHVPLKRHYTPREADAIRGLYHDAAKRVGLRNVRELYYLGNQSQRANMRNISRVLMGGDARLADIERRNLRDRVMPGVRAPKADLPSQGVKAAGFLANPFSNPKALTGAGATVVGVGRATVEDPAAVARTSLRTAKESITGIPQGIKALAHDPLDAVALIIKDYEDRYGSVLKDPKHFRERVKNEWGLTPYVLDATAAAGGTGAALGNVARTGLFARAAAAFERAGEPVTRAVGRAGTAAHRVVSEERPGLRFSGGEAGVRRQRTSHNLFVATGQRSLDKARQRAFAHALERANLREGPGGRVVTSRGPDGRRRAERVTALRPGEREVVAGAGARYGRVTVPSVRDLPGLRRYTGRVARDLGGQQSSTRLRLLTHRGRVLNRIDRQLRRLDSHEEVALKYMLQLGATPDENGLRVLTRRAAQIRRARQEGNVEIRPILEDTNDELRVIRSILRDPEHYLTPRAREVADELRAIQLDEAARDPSLTADQEQIRRMTPQGAALGVRRGPDVEFFQQVLGRLERDTETPGLAAFSDELAHLHPSERAARSGEMLRDLRRQARRAEEDVQTARRRRDVTRSEARILEQRGIPINDPEVRAARAQLTQAKRQRAQIMRAIPKRERRAGQVAGRLGEREQRGGPMLTPQVRQARAEVGRAQRDRDRIEAQLVEVEHRRARAVGRTEGRFAAGAMTEGAGRKAADLDAQARELQGALEQADRALADATGNLRAVERAAPRITPNQFVDRIEENMRAEDAHRALGDAEAMVREARDELQGALAAAPRVPDALHARLHYRELTLTAARQTREYVRDVEAAFRQVHRAARSKSTMRLEDAETFANKVRAVAEEQGLTGPAYWWSSIRPDNMPSLAAAGRGVRAGHRNRPYGGVLFHIGAEEFSPDVFTRGVERNIKRRFQHALVLRNLETHAYEWSRGRGGHGTGLTVREIKAEMDRRMIDPTTIELVDTRVIPRRPNELPGLERGRVLTEEELDNMPEEDFVTTTQQELASARRQWREVTPDELAGTGMGRYLVVPREVGETLDGVANRMDSAFWRGMEVVLKQKPARILLGAVNVPWLAFQVASNAFLTGLGGGVNPFNVYGAWKFWRGLDDEAKSALEAELGITHGHHFALDETNLGATNRRYIAAWRGFKQTRVMRAGHKVNPLNLMFRADEAQNNAFRRVLFYDRARKAAYERMGTSWKGIDSGITRLMERVIAQPPERQMALLARHGDEFEQVARHVKTFLGDYLTFTPSERFLLSRNVMFYGYLRFSLRFTFYTMPVAHPVMADILGNIGRLGADEVKSLFGVPSTYDLPASMLGQLYAGTRQDAQQGRLRSVPVNRFNPFLNAVTQMDGPQQVFGLVSPIYQDLADQAFHESSFTGQDWRIKGLPTPSEAERPRNYFGSMWSLLNPGAYAIPGVTEGRPRNRILQRDLLSLAFPYRAAEQVTLAPNQSDDALLWSPRPMGYADPEAKAGVARTRREQAAEPLSTRIFRQILPVKPRITAAPQVIAREREKEAAMRKREKRKPGQRKPRRRSRPTGDRYGGGSRGNPYGGASASGASRYGG